MHTCYQGDIRYQCPGSDLHGCMSTDLEMISRLGVKVLLVSGCFFSGKRTLINRLMKSGNYLELLGSKTRRPRTREQQGKEPFSGITFRDLFRDEPSLTISNIPMVVSNNSWQYWGKKYGFSVPEADKLASIMAEFFSVYYLSDIINVCQIAKKENKIVIIETTPNQEEAWGMIFPRLRIVHLFVNRKEVMRRAKSRKMSLGKQGSLVRKIKILEAFSMPEISSFKAVTIKARNNNWKDFENAVKIALSAFSYIQ